MKDFQVSDKPFWAMSIWGNGIEVGSEQEKIAKSWKLRRHPNGCWVLAPRPTFRPALSVRYITGSPRLGIADKLDVAFYDWDTSVLDVACHLLDDGVHLDAEYFQVPATPGWGWAVIAKLKAIAERDGADWKANWAWAV